MGMGLINSKKLSRFVCSAVEDEKQHDLRSGDGGLGFAIEDRPGKPVSDPSWVLV